MAKSVQESAALVLESLYKESPKTEGPFDFGHVWITPRGKLEYERAREEQLALSH